MKEIILTKGKIALVSDEDFEYVNQWKWCTHVGKSGFYAKRNIHFPKDENGKRLQKTIFMHSIIGNRIGIIGIIDHKDRNPLNNTRDNLRSSSNSQNGANRKSKRNSTSQYLGVHLQSKYNKWIASMTYEKKIVYIGCYSKEEEAAKAYDEKAKELHGNFANLNFP